MSLRSSAELSELKEHLRRLKQEAWLGRARQWWPDFLFHCTDIQNVVNILKSGELLSRIQVQETSQLKVDIASPEIIKQTSVEWQDYVRLYFRPRTPTQYRNEGFRPKEQWGHGAHCPVPVYLLLDAFSVLSRAESLFTDGNIAAGTVPMDSVHQLRTIPFNLVYHDTWFDPPNRSTIVYHRNAEVLVPKRLDLGAIRRICCRSEAEYETLLHLLPPGTRSRWVNKIGVQSPLNLFHNRWTFVQQTEMSDEKLILRFNQTTNTPGPFDARIAISEIMSESSKTYKWRNQNFVTGPNAELRFTLAKS